MTPYNFCGEILNKLLNASTVHLHDDILIVCGGMADKKVFEKTGFKNVVIASIDERVDRTKFVPYDFHFEDVENLSYSGNAFDFVVVHSGLHHCFSPHRAITEMYRVARKGILIFEPYDNLISRLGLRLGFGQEYEHYAVFDNDMRYGGVMNSEIPNYVYRFNNLEIIKTIKCCYPYGESKFRFFYKLNLPLGQLKGRKNKLPYMMLWLASPFLRLLTLFTHKLCNNFAALALKPDLRENLYPWLLQDKKGEVHINPAWLEKRYVRNDYPK